ncbi:MAG: T9SS type A sorting domain-containing protein, partial [Bacteroidota bacterium]
LDVTPGNNNSVVVASYQADLTTLAGGAAVVFASGFLNPGANQNGAGFGLWVTLPNGTTFPLPVTTSIGETTETSNNIAIYPNPATAGSSIQVLNNSGSVLSVEVISSTGQAVSSIQSFDDSISIDTQGWASGIYSVRTITSEKVSVGRVVIR